MSTQQFVRRTSRKIKTIDRLEPVWTNHEDDAKADEAAANAATSTSGPKKQKRAKRGAKSDGSAHDDKYPGNRETKVSRVSPVLSRTTAGQAFSSPADEWDAALDDKWEGKYQELCEYREKTGHCNVPKDMGLGRWVRWQREYYRKDGMLKGGKDDRVRKLENIGFIFDVLQHQWDGRFSELETFKREYGHCNVASSYGRLGRWVQSQRDVYSKREMGPERVQRLEDLGFVWARRAPTKRNGKLPVRKNPPRVGGSVLLARSPVADAEDSAGSSEEDEDEDDSSLVDSSTVGSEEEHSEAIVEGEHDGLSVAETPGGGTGSANLDTEGELLAELTAYRDALLGSLTPESSTHYWNVHKVIRDLEANRDHSL